MKISLIGYGKMGHMIEQIALRRGHEIVSKIDIGNASDITGAAFRSADVAIEFTSPASAYGNVKAAFAQGVKVVSGSTGWMDDHRDEMAQLCQGGAHTLFWSSNFSVGVALFNALSAYLARLMNDQPSYDVKITETHHVHKLDAPSGTAITLAEGVIRNLDRKSGWEKGVQTAADGTVSGTDNLAPDIIPIDSIRRGEVPGIHTVSYDSAADCISITHDAHSREGFALGAVMAAEFTATHSGLLTMGDLFPFID